MHPVVQGSTTIGHRPMRAHKNKQALLAPVFCQATIKKIRTIFSIKKRKPRNAATKLALNPKVQGGDTCGFLGFPSGGHAHQTQRDTAGLTFIGSRTLSDRKHSRASG